jgi:hypothetical protein
MLAVLLSCWIVDKFFRKVFLPDEAPIVRKIVAWAGAVVVSLLALMIILHTIALVYISLFDIFKCARMIFF